MTITAAAFRANFPEFKDPGVYAEPEIGFWLTLGLKLLNAERWGELLDFGQQLFVAHNLSLQFEAKNAGRNGQNPGQIVGPLTSAAVDKVSYSRAPAAVMNPSAGHWNLSIYGVRYLSLVRMVGAGPIQVGTGDDITLGAWTGPQLL